ncbi:MAG: carboxy terminal-processing peptidase [Ignavibacteriaceae bacterium]|nr:carboxy terminal-processing peptidase [Ignavibacteriaceae bacterium]
MKKSFYALLLFLLIALFSSNYVSTRNVFAGTPGDSLSLAPDRMFQEEDQLIQAIISRYHYKKFVFNDSLSSVVFDRYLKDLDYNRSYFYQGDIDKFEKYRNKVDDLLQEGDLTPFYTMYNLFRKRINERLDYSDLLLKKEFDYTKDESYEWKRDSSAWFKDTNEMNDYWRKKVKNDALNLKLDGKDWKSISETLTKRYENIRKAINQNNSEDIFQTIMNSYTESIDPHTNYMSPITSDNFKIDMSRSLEGIGAQLQSEDDYTKIAEIIPGGPAFKSKLINKGDKIVGVAQGAEGGEFVDVIGMRLTDVVQLIRGPKGTTVRLQILEANSGTNAKPKEIKLVRDKITLEEQSAKKEILEIKNDNKNYKIGVITIPAFYVDFDAESKGVKDFKSTTRDVKKLLSELKEAKVDGIVIDLRNNGGGSLQEAVQLTGLFIKDGPVVQVRNADGTIDEDDDPDPSIYYSGPLAVLVNKFSASASEIFSGAIQDYGRGLILGDQTYGKGTVQNMIDLNKLVRSTSEKYGQVKITIAKYYRITGGSTQMRGVIPDIKFPSVTDVYGYGESTEPSALPWDQIKTSKFTPAGNLSPFIPKLKELHEERVKSNPEFDYLKEDIEESKEMNDKKYVSLNEEVRKKEKDDLEEKRFLRENERRKLKGLKLLQKGETAKEESDKNDPLLDESAHVVADLLRLEIG